MMKAADIPPCPQDNALLHALLDKLVILKLNGGLGTTMGCSFPKSAIEVRQELSFLDMTVRQVLVDAGLPPLCGFRAELLSALLRQIEYLNSRYGTDVPLILMNSFMTHEITVKLIRKYHSHNITIHTFMQNCYPRIVKDTLLPLPTAPFPGSSPHEWYPPGHGDVYHALHSSGLLESLLQQGKEYVFISNIDNLGATVNLDLLYHLVDQDIEMCMCVAKRTKADHDGGVLVGYKDKPMLVETVQVPKEHQEQFSKTFKHFNTNNLWVSLRAIQNLVGSGGLDDVIAQERVVNGTRVVQLETLAGSAIRHLPRVLALEVDRSRYSPVKSTSDLMLVQSNLFTVSHGALVLSERRQPPVLPLVKLGHEFATIDNYMRRFARGVPDILELDHLTVSGDVYFGANITLKGTVIIVANEGSTIMIPDGAILEDKVVTGNLRILDH